MHYRYKDADIIYVSPSHMTRWGDVMPNKRRIELVSYSATRGSIVIEDDYESDFQYNSRPTPSLHALAGGTNVVYIGSFSRLLLPSIRISFMVLTEELAALYNEKYINSAKRQAKRSKLRFADLFATAILHLKQEKQGAFTRQKPKSLKSRCKTNSAMMAQALK